MDSATIPDTLPEPPAMSAVRLRTRLAAWIRANRIGLLAILALAAFGLGWSWWKGLHAPRRIGDLRHVGVIGIYKGALVIRSNGATLCLAPMSGGTIGPIATLGADPDRVAVGTYRNFDGNVDPMWEQYTDRGLVYYIGPSSLPLLNVVGAQQGTSGGSTRVEYRHVSSAEMGSARPDRYAGNFSAYLLPLIKGSRPQLVAEAINDRAVTISGDFAYWVERRHWAPIPSRLAQVRRNNVWHIPVFPDCDRLIRVRLGSRAVETVDGPGSYFSLVQFRDGILFTGHGPGTDGSGSSLSYLRNDTKLPLRLNDYRGLGFPVEMNGRLYWLRPVQATDRAVTATAMQLVSATPNLDAVAELGRIETGGRLWFTSPSAIVTAGDSLFIIVSGSAAIGGNVEYPRGEFSRPVSERPTIYRLRVAPSLSITKLACFPAGTRAIHQDGVRLIAEVEEERENWFDWSSKGLAPQVARVLYEYQLPH